MELSTLSIKKLQEGLKSQEFSAREVVEGYYARIEKNDGEIGAFLSVAKDEALSSADEIDERVAIGAKLPPLSGVTLAIKDAILVGGQPATAASKILKNYVAAYDATVIKNLKAAGAIILGKTNLDEFAMGSSTENSAFQKTKNPHDTTRVPGGSSGGSAAAVAAGFALAALGSDTGGSIRQPAALCGVVGLKPTYGAVSRYGLIAMASSLDQIGPFTKTVEDARIMFDAMRGYDPHDATSMQSLSTFHFPPSTSLTIGFPKEYFSGGPDKATGAGIALAMDRLKKLGYKFKEISLPHTKYALSCYYIIMPAEVSANLARFDGMRYAPVDGVDRNKYKLEELYRRNRSVGFGTETKRRIILGTFVLSSGYYDAYYSKAQKVRALIKQDFDEAFKSVDVIFTPVSPTTAFKFDEKTNDPLAMYLSDIFTIPVNLAGLPAISIPVKKYPLAFTSNLDHPTPNLPVGFQLIGKNFHESDLFAIGKQYEQE